MHAWQKLSLPNLVQSVKLYNPCTHYLILIACILNYWSVSFTSSAAVIGRTLCYALHHSWWDFSAGSITTNPRLINVVQIFCLREGLICLREGSARLAEYQHGNWWSHYFFKFKYRKIWRVELDILCTWITLYWLHACMVKALYFVICACMPINHLLHLLPETLLLHLLHSNNNSLPKLGSYMRTYVVGGYFQPPWM